MAAIHVPTMAAEMSRQCLQGMSHQYLLGMSHHRVQVSNISNQEQDNMIQDERQHYKT